MRPPRDARDSASSRVQTLGEEIDEANQTYAALPRTGGDAAGLLRAKFRFLHWRSSMLERLLRHSETAQATGWLDPEALVDNVLALGIRLDDAERQRLARLLDDREALARVLAQQGSRLPDVPEYHALAGPDIDLEIEVNRDSPWPFSRWKRHAAFSEYAFEGEGVRYRGLWLRPGDVFLADVNRDGNFVYSGLTEPKGFCPHSAVFVVLEDGDRRYPAVIETYEKGLRAVPLCVFLNARYMNYTEVHRPRHLPSDAVAGLGRAAHRAIERAVGYNFYTTEDDERRYVSCTMVAKQLYADVGVGCPMDHGRFGDPGIRETLGRLGYEPLDHVFTPVDYLLAPQFELVGWVDNHQHERLVARELVEARFRRCVSEGELERRRLPLKARVNHFGVRHMRRRTLLGKAISAVEGFDEVTLPKGPDWMLALLEPLEAELGKAVRGLLPEVRRQLTGSDELEIDAWLSDPALCDRVARLLPMAWLRR